ncbi:MAG: hypothetical protein ACRD3N_07630 [Terracidiphilus sp.]
MAYKRPTNEQKLSKPKKLDLLKDYAEHYRQQIEEKSRTVLNQKVDRKGFADLLDRMGEMLLRESEKLAKDAGPIRDFLNKNPLPRSMNEMLPDDFRVFCLALNSLKQWVAAEQAATDRYLLGGNARELCREAVKTCLVMNIALGQDIELHHPVRDGRPPIPLSKKGHDEIEGQVATVRNDPIGRALCALRSEGNHSWLQLRRGCLDLLGRPVPWPSKASTAGARAFAKKSAAAAGLGYEQILEWLDSNDLG